MLYLAALLTLGQPQIADPRLADFVALCIPHRQDLDAAARALGEAGWVQVADADHPELETTLARARAEAVDPEMDMTMTFTVWRSASPGVGRYIVLNRIDAVLGETRDLDDDGILQEWEKADDFTMLGCGLWDFDAEAPIERAVVTDWAGAEPVQHFDQPGNIVGGTWNVHERMPGTGEVHVGYIPEGSSMFAQTGFSGVSISMSSAPAEPTEAE